jgi:hypothetical protein
MINSILKAEEIEKFSVILVNKGIIGKKAWFQLKDIILKMKKLVSLEVVLEK